MSARPLIMHGVTVVTREALVKRAKYCSKFHHATYVQRFPGYGDDVRWEKGVVSLANWDGTGRYLSTVKIF